MDIIKQALEFDPLAFAEEVTGKSYKEDSDTLNLGVALHIEHGERKAKLLKENRDTYFGASLQEQLAVIEDLGFELLVCEDIPGTEDKYRMYWRNGILLFCDSYWGEGRLNGGSIFLTFKGSRDSFRGSSSLAGYIDDIPVFNMSFDVREGLRHTIESLEREGEILQQWMGKPFLWLSHYGDKGRDYTEVKAERIAMLPVEVQKAITVEE